MEMLHHRIMNSNTSYEEIQVQYSSLITTITETRAIESSNYYTKSNLSITIVTNTGNLIFLISVSAVSFPMGHRDVYPWDFKFFSNFPCHMILKGSNHVAMRTAETEN